MKQDFKKMVPYWQIILLLFYVTPFFIRDTGSAMFMLLGLIPVGCLITSALYGRKHGFHVFFGVLIALSFLPAVWIFYNTSALVYGGAYGLLTLLGSGIGAAIYRPDQK